VTVEIEKVAVEALRAVQELVPMRPGPEVLFTIQDRARQKDWLLAHGFPVGPYRKAQSEAELLVALRALGGKAYVKSSRGGYDGRGQAVVRAEAEVPGAWASLGGGPVVVEQALALRQEMSVLVARRPSGDARTYPPALNHHVHGVLEWSVLPGPFPKELSARAEEITTSIAEGLGVEGLLVAEFFCTEDGELLVNELAPRPHNTFHTTEVACATSQFEQVTRAVCDLPLGSTDVLRPGAIINLLGELWLQPEPPHFDAAMSIPGVTVHLYGKRVARPGRKMGHLSAIATTPEEALRKVQEARRRLGREMG
jgi:5-(carboxyamino)imidazole ribonucleotide synthase